ncbi:MAG: OPT family oligopeptide transporter [Opitutales bacterium]
MGEIDPKAVKAQLTWRAVLTGMVIGAILTPCNIYAGLKVGFSVNMSIVAGLISYGLWMGLHRFAGARYWGIYENNMNQTSASAAASILSAGLVAPIPALTILTGYVFGFPELVFWVFTVSIFGVVVAMGIARQMLEREDLRFPNGVATAETLKEMYASGQEAIARLKWLIGAGILSTGLTAWNLFVTAIQPLTLRLENGITTPSPLVAQGYPERIPLTNYGFLLSPSLLMVGIGVIAGWRVAWSILLGTILAWGIGAPLLLEHEWAILPDPPEIPAAAAATLDTEQPLPERYEALYNAELDRAPGERLMTTETRNELYRWLGKVGGFWYQPLLEWLLWPGVALMVAAALTSFGVSLGKMIRKRPRKNGGPENPTQNETASAATAERDIPAIRTIPTRWFFLGMAIVVPVSVIAQGTLFGIPIWLAVSAIALTFILAVVAARVSGETGIPPIGALGKITQVSFAALDPGNLTTNLMAANVTGGAAGQCSDLLHDLRTGQLIGANVRAQILAQLAGVLAGALAGSAAYLILVPEPALMLGTEEWPAPAVMTWKAVAQVLAEGFNALPPGAATASLVAGAIGVALAIIEARVPREKRNWVPSASAVGFAAILPPSINLAIFLGGAINALTGRFLPDWRARFAIVMAAGLVAGESLVGVLASLFDILTTGIDG